MLIPLSKATKAARRCRQVNGRLSCIRGGFLRRSYTIGGEVIFPKHRNSINQTRGTNPQISDCFDLTLECIRRYYRGEDSPLFSVLTTVSNFFDG